MAKSKTKSAKEHVSVAGLPTKKKKLAGKHMKKIKGGFTGGVRVAAGDVNGDGIANLIIPGPHTK